MKIYLIDNGLDLEAKNNLGGHNYVYRKTLNEISKTQIFNKKKMFVTAKENFFLSMNQKKEYLKKIPHNSIAHLLQLDIFYTSPNAIKILQKQNTKVIGTLHWFPNKLLKKFLLIQSAKYIDIIIVHSEFIKKQLNDIGIQNVKVIDYPVFFPQENIRCSKLEKEKVKLTCLGGTRYDKGLDILIQSFKYIDSTIKDKIEFVIVGKEKDIKYKDIIDSANNYGISVQVDNRIVPEEQYWKYIYETDIILLPYRKIFTGNSGPMTDGIYLDKYILGPNEGNLGYLIKKYDLGDTFIQEDSISLAEKINGILDVNTNKNHEYKNKLKIDNFIFEHQKIYKHILDNRGKK